MFQVSIPLFSELTDAEFQILESNSIVSRFPPGGVLIRENQKHEFLYIIVKGHAEVLKADPKTHQDHKIAELAPGDFLGEISLTDNETCSATVRALDDMVVKGFNLQSLKDKSNPDKYSLYQKMLAALANDLSLKMRKTNYLTIDALAKKLTIAREIIATGHFIASLCLILSLYILLLNTARIINHSPISAILATFGVMIALLFVGLRYITHSQLPFEVFGLTTNNWRAVVRESLLYALGLSLLALLAKWLLIHKFAIFSNEPLFNSFANLHKNSSSSIVFYTAVTVPIFYIFIVMIQEFLSRGLLQGSLQHYAENAQALIGADQIQKTPWPIIMLANLVYSVMHIHLSTFYAIFAFFPGLFWGWLFYRQKTLLGVCLCHAITGIWFNLILGFDFLLN